MTSGLLSGLRPITLVDVLLLSLVLSFLFGEPVVLRDVMLLVVGASSRPLSRHAWASIVVVLARTVDQLLRAGVARGQSDLVAVVVGVVVTGSVGATSRSWTAAPSALRRACSSASACART
jgi:hypothetical protein